MPAILTHYTFALSAIPEEDRPFAAIVNLGSQGPDTFMAYGTVPWKKRAEKKKIQQWGHTMHSLPVGSVYLKMMEYASKSPDKELLFAYIDGALMHYCVDRIFHPYIFYRSGFNEYGKLVGYWNWSHGFFEAVLDKTFAKRKGTYVRLWEAIRCDEEEVKKVSAMWAACSPAHLGNDDFYLSYEDFVSAEKLLYTPSGLKRPLFRLLGKYSTPYAQSHPRFMKKFTPMDVENNSHAEWRDPCSGDSRSLSLDEMFDLALNDFKTVHQLLLSAKEGVDIQKEFERFTRDLDHEGCPIGQTKQYHALCWEVVGDKRLLPPKTKKHA